MTNATKRVLKWTVPVDDLPHQIGSGKVLHVACQYDVDEVMVWTEEVDAPQQNRMVRVFGTGHPVPMFADHIGSVLTAGGQLVWHVYELATVHEELPEPGMRGLAIMPGRNGINGEPIRETWP